jgi:flavin reductase (DIM6/NTAB) family NADH-FMN oxidoreductase RutF
MGDTHFYEPKDGHGLPHDPFKAIVAPRPIGWISTVDAEGRPNLAPYSFFNAFCDCPPVVGFSSGGRKNSQTNVEETGEFVVNLATRRLADAMNRTSAALPHGVNKFEAAGLRAAQSRLVRPPRVADAAAALECRLVLVLPITDLDGKPTPNTLILGQVVGVHIDPAFLKDGLFDIAAAGTIARCGYRGDYLEVTRVFEMLRPSSWRTPGRDLQLPRIDP